MKPRGDRPVHGVELFRINLLKDLIDRGIRVSVPAERSWAAILRERLAERFDAIRFIPIPGWFGGVGTALIASIAALGEPHDVLLYGNPGRGMVPAMHLLQAAGAARRAVVFAHRRPKGDFLQKAEGVRFDTVCVSEHVAAAWRGQTSGSVSIMYGITNAGAYQPGSPDSLRDSIVRFVLLARLPNVSKGEGMAIEAFRLLPRELRDRCELHLAAFVRPPAEQEPGITKHGWITEGVPRFLQSMDVMLTLSSNETFSQSIVQGMLTELPIIATPLDVFTEKVGSERGEGACGYIAENAEAVAWAMKQLAENAELRQRMGQAGRAIALERYVWDTQRFIDTVLIGPANEHSLVR